MRPCATDSLYKDLEAKYGLREVQLPENMHLRPLNVFDLDAVDELEAAAFSPSERASRERIEYRLRTCPELCLGLFKREYVWDEEASEGAVGVAAAKATECKETIVGHILATKMLTDTIVDEAMEIPDLDKRGIPVNKSDKRGHQETGRFIGIHAVAIHPDFQRMGLGFVMLKDYVQSLFSLQTADGISIIVHDKYVSFYERNGFENRGKSECQYAGSTWLDMYLPFDTYDDRSWE